MAETKIDEQFPGDTFVTPAPDGTTTKAPKENPDDVIKEHHEKKAKAAKKAPKAKTPKSKGQESEPWEADVEEARYLKWDVTNDPDLVKNADDPKDPRWQTRQLTEPTKEFIESLSYGVDFPIAVSPIVGAKKDEAQYITDAGRKRVAAAPLAAALRLKRGDKTPLIIGMLVKAKTEEESMLLAARENEQRTQSTVMEKCDELLRLMDRAPEDKICREFGIKGPRLHELVTLSSLATDEMRKALDAGTISIAAALSIIHLTPEKIDSAVKRAEEAAALGLRTSTRDLKRAAGQDVEATRLTPGRIASILADLKGAEDLEGKHGEAVRIAAVKTLELVLDASKFGSYIAALKKLAKG